MWKQLNFKNFMDEPADVAGTLLQFYRPTIKFRIHENMLCIIVPIAARAYIESRCLPDGVMYSAGILRVQVPVGNVVPSTNVETEAAAVYMHTCGVDKTAAYDLIKDISAYSDTRVEYTILDGYCMVRTRI